jgi:hypothetical protein
VRTHPSYKEDSAVPDSINHDLIKAVIDIESGKERRVKVRDVEKFLGTNFGCGPE